MNPSKKQVVDKLALLRRQRIDFTIRHIPRLHRLLMEAFPGFKAYFNYMLAEEKDDPNKLTLLKGRKIIARNF